MKQLPLGVRLRAAATFASFAAGPNVEPIAALKDPQRTPLWLWGGRGCGKTHLLQAACAAAVETAAYVSLGRSPALLPGELSGFEGCGLLCVDDIDGVAGDAAWEHALFRLFNAAADLGTRLVFAAGAAPRGLGFGLEDLASRAASCGVYHLRDLDDAGRIDALRLRAAQRGLDLPAETSDYLLRRMPRDLPSLFEILDRLDEASLIAQRRLTVPFIRAALEPLADKEP
jgi:DnaA family protein